MTGVSAIMTICVCQVFFTKEWASRLVVSIHNLRKYVLAYVFVCCVSVCVCVYYERWHGPCRNWIEKDVICACTWMRVPVFAGCSVCLCMRMCEYGITYGGRWVHVLCACMILILLIVIVVHVSLFFYIRIYIYIYIYMFICMHVCMYIYIYIYIYIYSLE